MHLDECLSCLGSCTVYALRSCIKRPLVPYINTSANTCLLYCHCTFYGTSTQLLTLLHTTSILLLLLHHYQLCYYCYYCDFKCEEIPSNHLCNATIPLRYTTTTLLHCPTTAATVTSLCCYYYITALLPTITIYSTYYSSNPELCHIPRRYCMPP